MRKLKLQAHMTIDGFAASPNGGSDWVFLSGPDAAGFQKITELAATCDTLILGRKMVPEFVGYWQNQAQSQDETPLKAFGQLIVDMRKIGFSRTETESPFDTVEMKNDDLATAIQALKNQSGKDIIVYGGGEFVTSLVSLNLIDEYYIIVSPVAIGSGQSIFKEQKILKLESSTPFKNGKLMNKYLPV